MYQFTGCPCSVCGKTLAEGDDIVVCPDCGAPYHRACYEKQGACVYAARHGAFEWTPPASAQPERKCPNCGAANPESAQRCSHCGAPFAEGQTPPPRAGVPRQPQRPGEQAGGFNYARLYQQAEGGVWQYGAASADEPIDGISSDEWAVYLGPSSPAYLRDFAQMQRYGRKSSICFSALLFGPLYYFYRKAWKPAFAFLAIDLVLNLPALLELLVLSESPLAPAVSPSSLLLLAQLASILSFAVMVVSGMFAKYFYRRAAAGRIRRIQAAFPEKSRREAVLRAQGGVSWAAVVGVCTVMMVAGAAFSLLLGPNVDAVLSLLL